MEFFLDIEIPTVTHQQKQVAVIHGMPRFYEPAKLKAARQLYCMALRRHRPAEPMHGAVRLVTRWMFPANKRHKAEAWKTTRPDTDNLIKLLKDCMTAEGFWKDDAQVASETTEKMYALREGIFVKIENLEEDNNV